MEMKLCCGGSRLNRLIALWALFLLPIWAQNAHAQICAAGDGCGGILVGGPVSYDFSTTAPDAFPDAFGQFGPGRDGIEFVSGIALCDFCFPFNTPPVGAPDVPGTSLYPRIGVFISSLSGPLNCAPMEHPTTCYASNDEIDASRTITFPTNGKDFTVTVPARESGVFGQFGPHGENFLLGGAEGQLALNFEFIPESPSGGPSHYIFLQGTFTSGIAAPEPGPLALITSGLASLAILCRRRKEAQPYWTTNRAA